MKTNRKLSHKKKKVKKEGTKLTEQRSELISEVILFLKTKNLEDALTIVGTIVTIKITWTMTTIIKNIFVITI